MQIKWEISFIYLLPDKVERFNTKAVIVIYLFFTFLG